LTLGFEDAKSEIVEFGAGKKCPDRFDPTVNVLRGLAARATTPLLPDDYLELLNPLWSAREPRGLVVNEPASTSASDCGLVGAGIGGLPR
jgi:hypothetical protein